MRLRRRRIASEATLSLRRLTYLFGHSDQVCDAEEGNDVQEKDTDSQIETVKQAQYRSEKTLIYAAVTHCGSRRKRRLHTSRLTGNPSA